MEKTLLPKGFYDILGPDSYKKKHIITTLGNVFDSYGYEYVDPPLLEFEDSLLCGAGAYLEDKTLRLMDTSSDNILGIRADITPQIARIFRDKIGSEKLPTRLSYSGNVVRSKPERSGQSRQFTQAGLEILGVDSKYADSEAVITAIQALKTLGIGIDDISIDFICPAITDIILSQSDFSETEKQNIRYSLSKKDASALSNLDSKYTKIFTQLINTSLSIEDLQNIDLPSEATQIAQRLAGVIKILQSKQANLVFSIDAVESFTADYHKGIGFSIFSRSKNIELGRGGRYELIGTKGHTLSAVGFTFCVDSIVKILPASTTKNKAIVSFNTSENDVEKLIQDGYIVHRHIEENISIEEKAKTLGYNTIVK